MTKITKGGNPIKKGCYVKISEIKDTDEWKKVIDAFVNAGFTEYEGYTKGCDIDYTDDYNYWTHVGIDEVGNIYHWGNGYFSNNKYPLSVQEVLATLEEPPTLTDITVSPLFPQYKYKVVEITEGYFNGINALEDKLNEIGSEGWQLSSVVGCKYVFMKEVGNASI